ncbi:uncharacterized protein LOC115661704 [Syzygium oleosum]|uniref:uncharacterized protein LOC115661704 n=1 Tax=Syzygium oleosum TaxID=219896 RepID=UPI0024BBDAEB|nr:uncharacterized protein LOC115661704 [Syzygium oleosum]
MAVAATVAGTCPRAGEFVSPFCFSVGFVHLSVSPSVSRHDPKAPRSACSLPPSLCSVSPSLFATSPPSIEARPLFVVCVRLRNFKEPKCRCLSSRPNKQRPPPSPRGAHRQLRLVVSVRRAKICWRGCLRWWMAWILRILWHSCLLLVPKLANSRRLN